MDSARTLFGRRLRTLRKARGLTQEQLGWAARVDYKHIGAMERGSKAPSFDVVDRIAKAFKVEPFELFLPDRLAAGQLKTGLKTLLRNPDHIDPSRVRGFLQDMLIAVQKLENGGAA